MGLQFTLRFSTFQHYWTGDTEIMRRQGGCNTGGADFSQSALVSCDASTNKRTELHIAKDKQYPLSARKGQTAQTQDNETGGILFIGECLISAGLSKHCRNYHTVVETIN